MAEGPDEPLLFDIDAEPGLVLQGYRWPAARGPARATVILVHGLGEHARRYAPLAARLREAGFATVAYDQRGHGGRAAVPGDFGDDGWQGMLADLDRLVTAERERPVFVLGHSMGSMLAHQYVTRHGDKIRGVILSGSPGFASAGQARLLLTIARFERWRLGSEGQSALIRFLLFGLANRSFRSEGQTGFEWLSRDPGTVRDYVADPLCGFTPRCASVVDWFATYQRALTARAIAGIRQDLPIYLFSGSDDPMHDRRRNLERQLRAYGAAGLRVESRLYPGGRHEMLNETNREEVVGDLIAWLEQHCS